MQLEGYEEIEDPITYSPSNKPLELNYELKKRKGSFLITSVPEGASVYIDGAFKGLTPFSGSREFGTFEVKVELEGYRPSAKKPLIISNQSLKEINFDLIRMPPPGEENKFEDVEEIKIGDQIWMAKNLNVNQFKNGELIPEIQNEKEWKRTGDKKLAAWCYYDNDSKNSEKYGKLYNWYAVADGRGLCPNGWHVPSDDDWNQLANFLGGPQVAGVKLKSNSGWVENGNGNNLSGFNALPGGFRVNDGKFGNLSFGSDFWSISKNDAIYALTHSLSYFNIELDRGGYPLSYGFPVRCLKD
jgi:uncharacterized protein (TIGR02145 family)